MQRRKNPLSKLLKVMRMKWGRMNRQRTNLKGMAFK